MKELFKSVIVLILFVNTIQTFSQNTVNLNNIQGSGKKH